MREPFLCPAGREPAFPSDRAERLHPYSPAAHGRRRPVLILAHHIKDGDQAPRPGADHGAGLAIQGGTDGRSVRHIAVHPAGWENAPGGGGYRPTAFGPAL
ncbi:hypothetical protein GCM10022220_28750 [Actinocatenispora rupis]|uniref:Uncharacterized protein n=1 Tax=Actinocatenispora rupis TaxID=519421 RepID=A0A8J3J410_9ACTN|nr:hypothetical protein Aru02nite_24410 [Actinocatenispora rupis]